MTFHQCHVVIVPSRNAECYGLRLCRLAHTYPLKGVKENTARITPPSTNVHTHPNKNNSFHFRSQLAATTVTIGAENHNTPQKARIKGIYEFLEACDISFKKSNVFEFFSMSWR